MKLFPEKGKWFKGNLHMHTTVSDGRMEPEEAVAYYRRAGYDFLALTDHWHPSTEKTEDGLLRLAGCEWDTGDMVHTPVFHIVGVGMQSPARLQRSRELRPQAIIDAIRAAGGVAILAHPAWSLTDPADVMELHGLVGAEVYNTVSGIPWNNARPDSSLYFDIWAKRGRRMRCMAADDSHYYTGEQTRSFIRLKAPELSSAAVRQALAAGDFYASQGPEFYRVDYEDGVVTVECSPVERVVFLSNTVWSPDRLVQGGGGRATYRVEPTDRYVRVELVDFYGRRAWCSPFAVNSGRLSD